MANSKQSFFFDRVRSSANNKREIVVQGYAVDGFLDTMRPRAAIFVGSKAVKALKCRMEVVKLPPIQMRRRHGDTISYLAVIYVDMSGLPEKKVAEYGTSAKLVVVGESDAAPDDPDAFDDSKERISIYKAPMTKVFEVMDTYSFSVDVAYVEDGKTYVKGWMAGSEATVLDIVGLDKSSSVQLDGSSADGESMKYSIDFIPRDDVLMEYPECPDDAQLGFELYVDGEYKKLMLSMKEGDRKFSQKVPVGKSDDEFAKANVISRYSEKVIRNLRNYGVRETMAKVKVRLSPSYVNLNKHYNKWIQKISPNKAELEEQRKLQEDFEYKPLLSILVPLYETDEKFLDELIKSIQAQTYPNWEICFSDGSKDSARLTEIVGKYSRKDERVRYVAELPGPLGISSNTNQAFSIAKGDFIVLGDHDDLFTPDAFYESVKAMNENLAGSKKSEEEKRVGESEKLAVLDTEIDVIYTDEDKTNANARKRFEPNIKPDFNQELLESCNYITHMFVVRKSLVDEVGLFDDTYNGAQDYDFILRCTEKARKIQHVTKIVYSWRINDTSTAGNPAAKMYAYDAGVKALQAHYERMGINATAEIGDHLGYYHTRYQILEDALVFVAVMDADNDEAYNRTVESIKTKSDFKNLEFIRSENGSLSVKMNIVVDSVKKDLAHRGTAGEESDGKAFDSSKVFIMFIQAGVTMMGEDGISNMLSYISGKSDVAAIGAKLYAVGGTLSHAGVILDMGSLEGWMYTRHSKYDEMYFNYSAYSALRRGVTVFRLSDLEKYGRFDEDYAGEYAIIDYTYKMSKDGRKVIYDANAEYQVRPSRAKDADDCFESIAQKRREFRVFMGKHPEVAKTGDLYYSNSLRKVIEED